MDREDVRIIGFLPPLFIRGQIYLPSSPPRCNITSRLSRLRYFSYIHIYIYIRSRKNFICAEVLVRIPSDTCLPIVINTDSFFFSFFLFSLRGIEVESKRITVGSKHLSIDYSNCRVHHFCVEKKKNLPPKSHPYVTANSPSRFSIPVSPSPPIPGTTITRRESHVSIVLKANINSKLFKFHGDRGPARRH